MKLLLTTLSLAVVVLSSAFHVGVWKDRGGLKPASDGGAMRFPKNKRVEKYTDSDRALLFPQEPQIVRHAKDKAPPPLEAKERILRGDIDTVLPPGSHPDQDYPILDRKWGFPKAEKVRKDKQGQAPKLKDEERLWNQPKPGQILRP
jgi:hypothetical protein